MPFKNKNFSRFQLLRHAHSEPDEVLSTNFEPEIRWGESSNQGPDANGNVIVAHGLDQQPSAVVVTMRGDVGNVFVDVENVDATNITLRYKDGSGNDVTSGSLTSMWWAATDWIGG